MIPQSVKVELINSLQNALTFLLNGIEYTVKRRRQNQSVRVDVPHVVIAFIDEIPQEMFLGGKIGFYIDEDDNRIPLHGWVEDDVIYFDIYAFDDPASKEMNGIPLVDMITRLIRNYMLVNWDHEILYSNGMSLVEPLGRARYVNDFTGPEYSHRKSFSATVKSNYYYPEFTIPSMNTVIVQLEIGLREDADERDPTYFAIPTPDYEE